MTERPPPKDKHAEREAKLAQALRANLRRRKLESAANRPASRKPASDPGDSA
jgi:hypothetical protein